MFVNKRFLVLLFPEIPSKLGIMKNTHQSIVRPREEILSDICSVDYAVSGKITARERPLKNGGTALYYQLQQWVGGRNVTTHIPASEVDRYRDAVAGHERVSALTDELSAADMQALGAGKGDDAKKKLQNRPGASRGGCATSR